MCAFTFSVTQHSVKVSELSGLEMHLTNDVAIYYTGLSEQEVMDIVRCKNDESLKKWFSNCSAPQFAVFLHQKTWNTFYAFNDVFGYQEIFLTPNDDGFTVSSTIPYRKEETYNFAAIYELLSFQSVLPPQTVLAGVEIVPLAHCAVIDLATGSHQYEQYWDITDLFQTKAKDYDQLTQDLRQAFHKEIIESATSKSGVALSGGIDSGCILGILHDTKKRDIPSVSFGPYGKDSSDLASSRITAAHFGSSNTELYPGQSMFIDMFSVSRSLAVPVSGELLISNIQLMKAARADGIDTLYFGYGTQMMLGNLGLNQLWHKLRWFETLLPKFMCDFVYKLYLRDNHDNRRNILMANNWAKRFVYKSAPLLSREKRMFKHFSPDFVSSRVRTVTDVTKHKRLKLSDRIVSWYFSTWMNYGQGRNAAAVARVFGIEAMLPYNTPAVAKVLVQTPDAFRKKNNWDKQLWRDAVRPYIPQHLYGRKGKSLTIQYDKILLPQADEIVSFLKQNKLLQEVIDLELLQTDIEKLPEPGLFLLRLLSIALWQEAREGTARTLEFERIVRRLSFD